jgi:hypothetical protein
MRSMVMHTIYRGYYLDDGVYLDGSTVVKITCAPEEEKMERFVK